MRPDFADRFALRGATAALVAAALACQFVVLDAFTRGSRWLTDPRSLCDVATSAALGLALVLMATTRLRRLVLALGAAALLVFQAQVFRYYHVVLDLQVLASALHARHDVLGVLLRAAPSFALVVACVAVLEWGLLGFVHRALGVRWAGAVAARGPATAAPHSRALAAVLAVAALGGLGGLGPRRATPEVRAVHALAALRERREVAVATAVTLPPLHADLARLPSVLFVLTESVREDDYRGAPRAGARGDDAASVATAPETAALTPGRTELRQVRADSSYTALSLSAILTGRSQEGARAAIAGAPSLFDFAHAARDAAGQRPLVGYYASQSRTVFESDAVRAALDRFVTVETLRGRDVEDDADYGELPLDREVVDRFLQELPSFPAESVVMLHLIGTHAPYFLDPARAPFQPFDHAVSWSGMPRLLNAYRNAILEQDRTVARAVRAFVDHAAGRPWLVVFTSDHGEAFGEHGAIHHGQNLMDEQVHVPAWIASGNGALHPEQQRALQDHAGRFLTHLDVLPTMLDALGLWDNFGVLPYRAGMPGRSLLRAFEPRAPIPVTNCTAMFPCPLNTWGLYDGDRKLISRVWDGGWSCFALGDAGEHDAPAPDAACDRLRLLSQRTFPRLPNGAPNR